MTKFHLTIKSIVLQAQEVVGIVKSTIQFHDDESLQHALDKVKERPLIGKKYVDK